MEPSYTSTQRIPKLALPSLVVDSNSNPSGCLSERVKRPSNFKHTKEGNNSNTHPLLPNGAYLPIKNPPRVRWSKHIKKNKTMNQDETTTLHPDVEFYDRHGDAIQKMLQKWAIGPEEDTFNSVALYCDVKFQEAKQMTSNVENPNRFLTTSCCTLFEKLIKKLGPMGPPIKRLYDELLGSIFANFVSASGDSIDLDTYAPYFVQCRILKKEMKDMINIFGEKEKGYNEQIQKVLQRHRVLIDTARTWHTPLMSQVFLQWKAYIARKKHMAKLFCKLFKRSSIGIKDIFRAWRIEALRRGYKRESEDYQSMLALTTESLNRKDLMLKQSNEKVEDLAAKVDDLAEKNILLQQEVKILKELIRDGKFEHEAFGDNAVTTPLSQDKIDENEPSSGPVNQQLLETLFSMARIVEGVSIQSAKEAIYAAENSTDGHEMYEIAKEAYSLDDGNKSNDGNKEMQMIEKLASEPFDLFLLKWVQNQLKQAKLPKGKSYTIKNLGADLSDGRRFASLLNHLYPDVYTEEMCGVIDPEDRVIKIVQFAELVDPPLPTILKTTEIVQGHAPSNCAFIGMLFARHCEKLPHNDVSQYKEMLNNNVIKSWKKLRSLLLDIKRRQNDCDKRITTELVRETKAIEMNSKDIINQMRNLEYRSSAASSLKARMMGRILNFAWSVFEAKISSTTLEIYDERENEIMACYTSLKTGDITDILHTGEFNGQKGLMETSQVSCILENLRNTLTTYSRELHSIFRHYSAGAFGSKTSLMNASEFLKFAKEANIMDKKVTGSIIDLIYRQSLRAHDSSKELTAAGFSIALLRIAEKKYPHLNLEDRLEELLITLVLPNASRSHADQFRKTIASPDVQNVLLKHKNSLQKVFRYYACINESDEHRTTIDLVEFQLLAKDCKLIGTSVTERDLEQIFINIQQDDDDDENEERHLQVDFSEFQEALAALTEFVICNPYIPLFKRLDQFIIELFLPRARQKKKT